VTTTRAERLYQPGAVVLGSTLTVSEVDLWSGDPAPPQSLGNEQRMTNLSQDIWRISPQRTAAGERCHRARVILEIGKVHDGVTGDVSGRVHKRTRTVGDAEISPQGQTSYRAMLIEITKGIDRRHRKPGPGRRSRRCADRYASDEHSSRCQGS
jgi:hypothetical protein